MDSTENTTFLVFACNSCNKARNRWVLPSSLGTAVHRSSFNCMASFPTAFKKIFCPIKNQNHTLCDRINSAFWLLSVNNNACRHVLKLKRGIHPDLGKQCCALFLTRSSEKISSTFFYVLFDFCALLKSVYYSVQKNTIGINYLACTLYKSM